MFFFSIYVTAFSLCKLKHDLVKTFASLQQVIIKEQLSDLAIYTASPSQDENWLLLLLVAVHFACPTISSILHFVKQPLFIVYYKKEKRNI